MSLTHETFAKATGGYKSVPDNWMPATGLRSLILEDPALLWLQFHGAKNGFEKDPTDYDFLTFIGTKGVEFEKKWISEVAPKAVYVLSDDREVRQAESVAKTLKCLKEGHDVICHAALWCAAEKIYGAPDLIVKASWLRKQFPHLAHLLTGEVGYQIVDCKFMSKLDQPEKANDLEIVSAQMRLYSHMLAEVQGHAPKFAFLATRDRPFDPVPVEIHHVLGQPLEPELADLRDTFLHIKANGASLKPWKDSVVAANYSNQKDTPWHLAKKKIAKEYIPGGPVEWLPHVGSKQAAALSRLGISCLDDALKSSSPVPFHALNGIGPETAKRIQAVLKANKTKQPSDIPAALVPRRRKVELMVDYEYFTDIQVDFDRDWPEMKGCPMIFMVGIAFWENGEWRTRQFVAAHESEDAERDMLTEFGEFLKARGVLSAGRDAALYHWSAAEIWQSKYAAERHNLKWLDELPWVDLQEPFHAGPIALPGAWGFGIKEIATSLPSEYRVKWPDGLGVGLAAMVAGFAAYEQPEPKSTPEMKLLGEYLKVDCIATGQILRWMRKVAIPEQQKQQRQTREAFWYKPQMNFSPRLGRVV